MTRGFFSKVFLIPPVSDWSCSGGVAEQSGAMERVRRETLKNGNAILVTSLQANSRKARPAGQPAGNRQKEKKN